MDLEGGFEYPGEDLVIGDLARMGALDYMKFGYGDEGGSGGGGVGRGGGGGGGGGSFGGGGGGDGGGWSWR